MRVYCGWLNRRNIYFSILRTKRSGVRVPCSAPCAASRSTERLVSFCVKIKKEERCRDSNPERVRRVKKTVRGTVFSAEVRAHPCARTADARRSRGGCVPCSAPEPESFERAARFFLCNRRKPVDHAGSACVVNCCIVVRNRRLRKEKRGVSASLACCFRSDVL